MCIRDSLQHRFVPARPAGDHRLDRRDASEVVADGVVGADFTRCVPRDDGLATVKPICAELGMRLLPVVFAAEQDATRSEVDLRSERHPVLCREASGIDEVRGGERLWLCLLYTSPS